LTKTTPNASLRKTLPSWAWPGLIPLIAGSKLPIEKGYTTACASRYADADFVADDRLAEIDAHLKAGGNVGWVPPEGVMVVDCDNMEACSFVAARAPKSTPVQARVPNKKMHFYFRYSEYPELYSRSGIKLDVDGIDKATIDLKTCGNVDPEVPGGGYAVIPPSTHEDTDNPYRWAKRLPKDPSKIPALPLDLRNAFVPWLTKNLTRSPRQPAGSMPRHDLLRDYIMRAVRYESPLDPVAAMTRVQRNAERYADELFGSDKRRLKSEVVDITRSVEGAWKKAGGTAARDEQGLDVTLARLISASFGDPWYYVETQRCWYEWNNTYWEELPHIAIEQVVQRFGDTLLEDAIREHDTARREKLMKLVSMLGRSSKVTAVAAALKREFQASADTFDTSTDLVTLPGCEDRKIAAATVNMVTGEVMKPDPDHRITKVMGAPYSPGASHPMVERFLKESFPDPETRRCVLMHLGASLLGTMPVERFYFMHGKGASGKGTLAGAMLAALGGYATVADPSTFSGNGGIDGSKNAPDLYALRGARFVFVDEIAASRVLGSRLKNLTQDGTITAAGKFMKQETFPVTWTTWIAGNARPKIDSTDKGLMRRIVEVPMDGGAKDNDHIDWHVKDTLKSDPEAITAFMWKLFEGLDSARDHAFNPPLSKEMVAATAEWVEMSDMLGPWLAEQVEVTNNKTDREMSSALFADYEEWMDNTYGFRSRRDVPRATPNQFAAGLKARGLFKRSMTRGAFWFGLKLRRDSDRLAEGAPSSNSEPKLPN